MLPLILYYFFKGLLMVMVFFVPFSYKKRARCLGVKTKQAIIKIQKKKLYHMKEAIQELQDSYGSLSIDEREELKNIILRYQIQLEALEWVLAK